MTTDSVPKTAVAHGAGFTVGGMAKGAGMLAPSLATMLVVLTTDAVADAATLDSALRAATRTTFDRVDSDGCTSTNDTVLLLASGASGVGPVLRRPGAGRRGGLRGPRAPAGRRRRGGEQGDPDRRRPRRERGRRRVRRARHLARQPGQVRDPRRGPELGPHPGRARHDRRRLRARRGRRRHQRRVGLSRRRHGRGPRSAST